MMMINKNNTNDDEIKQPSTYPTNDVRRYEYAS